MNKLTAISLQQLSTVTGGTTNGATPQSVAQPPQQDAQASTDGFTGVLRQIGTNLATQRQRGFNR